MGSYAINISKDGKKIGTFYRQLEYIETLSILDEVRKILVNYNKHLSHIDIPNEVLAHRMIEKQDVSLTLKDTAISIETSSYNYLIDAYPGYNWSSGKLFTESGKLSFTKDDMEYWNNLSDVSITVEMDHSMLILHNMYHRLSVDDYIKDFADGDKSAVTKLYTIDFNQNHFYMNALDEIYDVLSANKDGFRHPAYKNLIFAPISREYPKYEGIVF